MKLRWLEFNSPHQNSTRGEMPTDHQRLLLGVFDGHGPEGHRVSAFIKRQLPHSFLAHLMRGLPAEDALPACFAAVNERMETAVTDRGRYCGGCGGAQCGGCRPACGFDAYGSGSTAVVTYLEVGAYAPLGR